MASRNLSYISFPTTLFSFRQRKFCYSFTIVLETMVFMSYMMLLISNIVVLCVDVPKGPPNTVCISSSRIIFLRTDLLRVLNERELYTRATCITPIYLASTLRLLLLAI